MRVCPWQMTQTCGKQQESTMRMMFVKQSLPPILYSGILELLVNIIALQKK